jgi:hypothetical protein
VVAGSAACVAQRCRAEFSVLVSFGTSVTACYRDPSLADTKVECEEEEEGKDRQPGDCAMEVTARFSPALAKEAFPELPGSSARAAAPPAPFLRVQSP